MDIFYLQLKRKRRIFISSTVGSFYRLNTKLKLFQSAQN